MAKIIYVPHGQPPRAIEVSNGKTLMEGARVHNIPGIEADCGGNCTCSTCHVYIDPGWLDILPEIQEQEAATLEFTIDPDLQRSRLACQITVSEALNGLTVYIPEYQA